MNSSPWLLHADDHWYVVNKPTHISTHGAWEGDLALVEWLALHREKSLFVCSRLDKGTSGVLVFARTKEASGEAQRIHEDEASEKRYVFVSRVASSSVAPERSTWVEESPLDGKSARTEFRFLERVGNAAFFEATIKRGRTHQIRIHASRSGVPLLGDTEYGGAPFPRLMLHCAEVHWPRAAMQGATLGATQSAPVAHHTWTAPLPHSFEVLRADATAATPAHLSIACAHDRRLSYPASIASAYRVLHRGEAELPGVRGEVAIDRYGKFLSVWWYGEPLVAGSQAFVERERALDSICESEGARGAVVREMNRDAHKRGLVGGVSFVGQKPPAEFTVEEHGQEFVVSLTERQHLGLFLDQRDNRRRVFLAAKGARVANLFSYSCSFSVFAAAAECEVVFSVDAAESALALGKRNFEHNHLVASRRGKFVAEDVRAFLDRQMRKAEREGDKALFDIVVCDPPTFSSTRELGTFHVAEEWEQLARGCESLLKQGGVAYFSTNHRAAEHDAYESTLRAIFHSVTRFSAPMDFPEFDGQASTTSVGTHVKLFCCHKALLPRKPY